MFISETIMPCWYYDKKELKNTPSAADGIDYDTECRYRKEGARFIVAIASKMDLGYNTIATGVVYFHRFYMFHSFRTFPRYVTACCCLFLAGKVEETPKKCRDIIEIVRESLSEQKFATFGDDPKEEVMTLERILLQTIKFDLQVEHPYSYVVKYAKCLKGDKAKLHKMVQMAWTFVNDSLCTTLSLQWEPEVIAVALMYLAGKLSQFEVQDWTGRTAKHLRWWDMFVQDVTMDLLEDICHQVLDLYSQPQSSEVPDSPPLVPHQPTPEPAPAPIPVKVTSETRMTKNGQESHENEMPIQPVTAVKSVTVPTEISTYQYPGYPGPPMTYPPTFTTPMTSAPHMANAPPPGPPPPVAVYHPPPFVAPPPHYPPVAPAPPFYQPPPNAAQPHRPYYPPPT